MDRYAAAKLLGISLRSLQRYVKDKKISATYVDGSPEFSEEELLRFKERKQEPTYYPAIAPKNDTALSPPVAPEYLEDGLGHMEAIAYHYQLAAMRLKLTLTLSEAAKVSGLSKGVLKQAAKSGALRFRQIGRGYSFRLKDLEEFVDEVFIDL